MFQNYKVINEIDLKAGFVTNYLQLLN
jgi:hypothetical protein